MNLLPKSSSNQIIAQYNIQDIVTIIKELLENSLDSGADTIEIKIQESGKNGIIIQDNGTGIKSENMSSVCRQGCTSKLEDSSDMSSLKTLGFRGVALFSISKIASLTIETRHLEDSEGWSLTIQDGAIRSTGRSNLLKGTKILVSNIFFGNPIRSQDLMQKKDLYIRKVTELVQSYNIFYFNKKISLENSVNDKKIQLIPAVAASSLQVKLRGILGSETLSKFKTFSLDRNGIKGEMTMSNPNFDLKKKLVLCFVNGRLVNPPKVLLESMNLVFSEFKKTWSFILFLNVPRGLDVNVSVDKMTVLVEDEKEILQFFNDFFRHVLQSWTEEVPLKTFVQGVDSLRKNKVEVQEKKEVQVLPLNFQKVRNESNFDAKLNNGKNLSGLKEKTQGVISGSPLNVSSIQMLNSLKSLQSFESSSPDLPIDSNNLLNFSIPNKSPELSSVQKNLKEIDSFKTTHNQFPVLEASALPYTKEINEKLYLQFNWTLSSISSSSIKLSTKSFPPTSSKSNLSKDIFQNFHKSEFLDLDIKGQFNKGFIIAQKSSKLFIIDQHAADEKFLFETLQKSTEIHSQPLIVPQRLNLSACDEIFLLENLEIFKENGFSLVFKEENPEGSRFSIQSFPFSFNVVFGVEDFYESFLKLKEFSGIVDKKDLAQAIRCKKFRDMFASRACRKAVMIGTDLSMLKMKEIVKNLNGLDRPWNCPHGRPTIKLLIEQDFNLRRKKVDYSFLMNY
jgi:DNA mismatch repair protein PMS2